MYVEQYIIEKLKPPMLCIHQFNCILIKQNFLFIFSGFRDSTFYEFIARIMVNNVEIVQAQVEGQHNVQDLQGGNAVIIKLNKDDQVCVQQKSGKQLGSYSSGRASSFSGVLLYPSD